ncbi:hypothetical protein QBE53_06335 [Vallitaleaceae bacterium 9-2]
MKYKMKRYVERIRELIDEADDVLDSTVQDTYGDYIGEKVTLNAWLTKVKNIVQVVFGTHSIHKRELNKLTGQVSKTSHVKAIKGLLIGALDDVENGFIEGQEFVIAGEIFDSVLEEAKHLLKAQHKDPAAVLGRVVVEDTLKRIARREDITENLKAARLNDELKKQGVYSTPQWRLIQSWLDVGNSAAHGKFDDYDFNDVVNMLNGIEQFMANTF